MFFKKSIAVAGGNEKQNTESKLHVTKAYLSYVTHPTPALLLVIREILRTEFFIIIINSKKGRQFTVDSQRCAGCRRLE